MPVPSATVVRHSEGDDRVAGNGNTWRSHRTECGGSMDERVKTSGPREQLRAGTKMSVRWGMESHAGEWCRRSASSGSHTPTAVSNRGPQASGRAGESFCHAGQGCTPHIRLWGTVRFRSAIPCSALVKRAKMSLFASTGRCDHRCPRSSRRVCYPRCAG